MCRDERYSHKSVDPVDLPLMLLCWLRKYTEALMKWATDVGPQPCKMIERVKEREGLNPEWVAHKKCSECMGPFMETSWLKSCFFNFAFTDWKWPLGTHKLLKALLFFLISFQNLVSINNSFHLIFTWQLHFSKPDEARSLSRILLVV